MPDSLSKVQNLSLENFTAFEKATFNFCPGINVLIGANGTGKSHVMKVMYALLKECEIAHRIGQFRMIDFGSGLNFLNPSILYNIFQTVISGPIRQGKKEAFVKLNYENTYVELGIGQELNFFPDDQVYLKYKPDDLPNPPLLIYLPTQEFLSISEGFIAAYDKRELPYDETYYHLSLALNALPLREDKLAEMHDVITFLRKIIAGEQAGENEVVTLEGEGFKFSLPEGKLDVHLVAEGYRKIATLYYLLRNGSLTKDSILFWDEPEANLNPKLVVEVAKVLQMLAKAGMQIFITTHDYLLSHELSLLAEYPAEAGIDLRFFALYKPDRKAGVLVETGQTLAEIENNPILEEFAAHYERESALFQQTEPVQ